MMCPMLCRGQREMGEDGWGMGGRVQLIAWWWNFSVSFIIKQFLSVIDLRRGVSESCGIREPNCSEAMHYSTGILTGRLARACQFLSGGLGVAATLYRPHPTSSSSHTQWHMHSSCVSINIYATHTHTRTHTQSKHPVLTLLLWLKVVDCCFALWSTSHSTEGLIYNELTDAAVCFHSQEVIYGHQPFPAHIHCRQHQRTETAQEAMRRQMRWNGEKQRVRDKKKKTRKNACPQLEDLLSS